MPDYAAQLVSVNLAIAAIEGGAQSYSIAGRSLSRGDLSTLYAERRRLEVLVGRAERGGGIRNRGVTPV